MGQYANIWFILQPDRTPGHFCSMVCAGSVLSHVSGNGAQANVLAVNTPEEITRAMLNAGDRNTVLLASSPGGRVRRALANGARPFLVAMDDPRRVLADLVIGYCIWILRQRCARRPLLALLS